MKDRNTQYRLAQNTAMACTFDSWIPGGPGCPFPATRPVSDYLEQLVGNARTAGETLEKQKPSAFGITEKPFFLTEAQIGKVRGDIFETICRAILWNCCVQSNVNQDAPRFASLTLGDNYDLRRLFTLESGKKLGEFMNVLKKKGVSLSYSTPDIVVLDISSLPKRSRAYFQHPIRNLAVENQERMNKSRDIVAGLLTPKNVLFACGIKTSIRSDRMFQFLFEANAWKFIWRRVFGLTGCPYHSLTTQTFGADPTRLHSIDFSALGGASTATRAIDSVTQVLCPKDIQNWFDGALGHALNGRD